MSEQIIVSSELMKNQKHADVMKPDAKFEVLQTKEGNALFFSIGDDNVFYLTQQVTNSTTGWTKVDLSSQLASFHGGATIAAKHFDISQNPTNGKIDLGLVISVNDADYLYLSLGNSNDMSSWGDNVSWLVMPFDDPNRTDLTTQVITKIYIEQSHGGEYFVADILKNPQDSTHAIYRYYIDPAKQQDPQANAGKQIWNEHTLPADFDGTDYRSLLGRKNRERVDGIYTLGSISGSEQLIYVDLYNPFGSGPPNPIRLTLPDGASAMAVARVGENKMYTDLYVAGNGVLYRFPYDEQSDGATASEVVTNDIFKGVQMLYAHTSHNKVVIWGLNQQGEVFYTQCELGQETNSSAWSYPLPLLVNVEQIATYLNLQDDNNIIFAHTNANNLVQLTQDPVTSHWSERNILLPTTSVDDVIEFTTYTTHIQLSQEDNLPLSGATLSITSTSSVSVYINNVYHLLSSTVPIDIETDETGTVTIMQETQSIGVVCYSLAIKGTSTTVDVNPMKKLVQTMSVVKTREDLDNIQVTNADDTTQPLVPAGTSKEQKVATVQAIQQLVQINSTMPASGANKDVQAQSQVQAMANVATRGTTLSVSMGANGWEIQQGGAAKEKFIALGVTASPSELESSDEVIYTLAGDFFHWVKHVIDDVTHFFIHIEEEVAHFFVEIEGKIIGFVMNCVRDVVQAIEFVFKKIKVFIEDLIKWLGFLFQWNDIIRTHNVFKNIIKQYIAHSIQQIDVYKTGITNAFEDVEARLNEWAGLESLTDSLSEKSSSSSEVKGQNDPQSHWGNYHLKNGVSSSNVDITTSYGVKPQLESLMQDLSQAITEEEEIIKQAFDSLQSEVLEQIQNLSAGDIIKRIIAIIGDILIESVKNIIISSIDVMEILVEGVFAVLDTSIDIPIISRFYKEITGNNLSLLDLACLIIAIPSTLIYKLVYQETPYLDNSFTRKLIAASSWKELQQMFQTPISASNNYEFYTVMASGISPESADTDSDTQRGGSVTVRLLRLGASQCTPVFIALSVDKAVNDNNEALSAVHCVFFFATTGPNIAASLVASSNQRWDRILGEVIYGITAVEKIIDIFTYRKNRGDLYMESWAIITKWVDCLLGFTGFIPTISSVAYNQSSQTVTGMIGNACWNSNRLATPFADIDANPQTYTLKMFLLGLYAVDQFILYVIS